MINGSNNSGKSTLLHIIAGVYEPTEGYISYNGYPQGNLDLQNLRSVIGDCLMEEQLFEGSLLDNIGMRRKNATMDNIHWAVENLGLTEFIRSQPKGYNTVIQPAGQHFSKGIIDRLILARSIADKPKLLIVKDAFQSIKTADKERIIDFLTSKEQQWTLIAASSDEYLAKKMDKIYQLENGEIIREGNYEEMKNKII